MTDVIIIGAGVAGMTAALIASDGGLSVRLIDKSGVSPTVNESPHFTSLPFLYSFSPLTLGESMAAEVSRRGIELIKDTARSICKYDRSFSVTCDGGIFKSYCVIVSAGDGHGIIRDGSDKDFETDEDCRASPAGLMLCGNARRKAGLLRCIADGIVCGDTAKEWVTNNIF